MRKEVQTEQPRFVIETLENLPDPQDVTTWFVEGLIVEGGLNYLTALPGHGKSLVSLDLAHSCTHGRKFLNRFDVPQVKVLYLDQDSNNPRELNKRLLAFGFEAGADLLRMNQQGFRIDVKEDVMWLRDTCDSQGIKLVILDAMVRFHRQSEGDPAAMALLRDHLQMLTAMGVTILLIHHNSRTGGFRGSGEIAAMADAMSSLKKSKNGREFTLSLTKERTFSDLDWNAIRINPYSTVPEDEDSDDATRRTYLVGEPYFASEDDEDGDEVKGAVLDACAEEPKTKTEIRKAVGGDTTKVDAAIESLLASLELTMTKQGKKNLYQAAGSSEGAEDIDD